MLSICKHPCSGRFSLVGLVLRALASLAVGATFRHFLVAIAALASNSRSVAGGSKPISSCWTKKKEMWILPTMLNVITSAVKVTPELRGAKPDPRLRKPDRMGFRGAIPFITKPCPIFDSERPNRWSLQPNALQRTNRVRFRVALLVISVRVLSWRESLTHVESSARCF